MSEQKFYIDINEEEQKERAILVGADFDHMEDFDLYMDELKQLARACNMEVVCIITQKLDMPNKATLIGPGKVEEVKESAVMLDADIVIFAQTLSPSQLRNLQNQLHIAIMDRTSLILEIFSKRARTREAKIQVEVARLQYTLPRLVGLHEALSRQGGGSGSMSNKGAGEKKLELDRRYLENRLAQLRRELKDLEENRQVQRKRRDKNGVFRVALVGYTNAGKSTLMNAFIDYGKKGDDLDKDEKKVFEKDMLFATLDTTVRRIEPEGKIPFLLTDTVGFVSHLPHALVEAFHSTLEETKDADVLLHVV
ncbi:MAG: GTPase HflX, partial [Lachnospiraceae bacterium]|nr:GTPase HflX [Lachnospiraceae bacterium]